MTATLPFLFPSLSSNLTVNPQCPNCNSFLPKHKSKFYSWNSNKSSRNKTLRRIECSRRDGKGVSGSPDKAGAGRSWVSPDWLTSFMRVRLLGPDASGIPVASAKLDDVKDLLGGALFLPLFKWMEDCGPVYRLAAGPRNFVVISDPEAAKHVLRNYGKYAKGLVSEVSEFLFGSGFAIAEGQLWTVRRRAVLPSLHRKYPSVIVDNVFLQVCREAS